MRAFIVWLTVYMIVASQAQDALIHTFGDATWQVIAFTVVAMTVAFWTANAVEYARDGFDRTRRYRR